MALWLSGPAAAAVWPSGPVSPWPRGSVAQWLSGPWLRGPRGENYTTHKTYLQLILQLIGKHVQLIQLIEEKNFILEILSPR